MVTHQVDDDGVRGVAPGEGLEDAGHMGQCLHGNHNALQGGQVGAAQMALLELVGLPAAQLGERKTEG